MTLCQFNLICVFACKIYASFTKLNINWTLIQVNVVTKTMSKQGVKCKITLPEIRYNNCVVDNLYNGPRAIKETNKVNRMP